MKRIFFLGECMIELRHLQDAILAQSFAGDVYNSAVYLKRCFQDIDTSIVTAVGKDKLSLKMIERFREESINTDLVYKHNDKVAGMYLIETDPSGEREFTYWRSDSAARQIISLLDEDGKKTISSGDILFFSGISLAVIEADALSDFWNLLEYLKSENVKVVFDPNFRSSLWPDKTLASEVFERAFQLSDIALPGVEDMANLYGIDTAHGILAFCEPFDLELVVINNGSQCVVTFADDEKIIHDVTPVENVVDTTSAGDAFNGAFLGAYLSGYDISAAVKMATRAAANVIQHPGAIVPEDAFRAALPHIKSI